MSKTKKRINFDIDHDVAVEFDSLIEVGNLNKSAVLRDLVVDWINTKKEQKK